MILNRDEFNNTINTLLGQSNDENSIATLENIMDTYDDLNQRAIANEDTVPREEYERANNEWARKYRERFFNPDIENDKEDEKNKDNNKTEKRLTFENLFKKE